MLRRTLVCGFSQPRRKVSLPTYSVGKLHSESFSISDISGLGINHTFYWPYERVYLLIYSIACLFLISSLPSKIPNRFNAQMASEKRPTEGYAALVSEVNLIRSVSHSVKHVPNIRRRVGLV